MDNEKLLEMVKELINEYYDEETYNWTAERSMGNYDDCFNDGYESGQSCLAYQIGKMLGMDLVEPEEIE